ncbi:MAG TPA: DUF4292 domain-containing protein [Bacteroidia bacterium]|jgi:hypothetical protein
MNKRLPLLFHSVLTAKMTLTCLLIAISLFIISCKTRKKITLNNGKCILDFKNARTLSSNLKAKEFKFDRLNGKLSADTEIDSSTSSFTITLRMKKDSVIWMSLSKLGIEGARLLITKDSVKFFKRPLGDDKGKFFVGDYTYISKIANTDLDFEMLQSLLVGNSVEFYDEDEKIKPGINDCQYTLGTIRKNRLRKVMEKGKELREPAQSIYLIPETFKISRILFYEFNPDRSFDARYSEYAEKEGGQLFPMKMNYTIKASKTVKMDLAYTKITLNEEQTFPFKIPDNYERIVIKEQK